MKAPEHKVGPNDRSASPTPGGIVEAAAEWIVRRDAGLGPAEQAELQSWLAADPRHATAFTELAGAWATLSRPRLAGRGDTIAREITVRETRRIRRWRASAAAGLAAAAALAFAFLPSKPERAAPPTAAIRPDRQDLPDGSSVEMNAATEIDVDFSPTRRDVRLLRGEALFAVTKDPIRPFVVAVGNVEVSAVGTAFTVRHTAKKVDVLVTEGCVAVLRHEAGPLPSSAAPPVAPIYLSAGNRLQVSHDVPISESLESTPVGTEEMANALAWRNQRVEFTETPLAEAVALFNRQNRLQLSLRDTATAELRITGIVWTNDVEGFVRLLEASLDVKGVRGAPDQFVLRK